MMKCIVCGVDYVPENIERALEHCLEHTMNTLHEVDFVMGDSSAFDRKAYEIINRLRGNYFGVKCSVCLDREKPEGDVECADAVVPPFMYMIKEEYRRRWRDEFMLNDAELMIAYFPDLGDPAAQIMERAHDRHINGVNLAHGNEIQLYFWNPMAGE